jgi:hypothetical protein
MSVLRYVVMVVGLFLIVVAVVACGRAPGTRDPLRVLIRRSAAHRR